jgi:hypothetical protein
MSGSEKISSKITNMLWLAAALPALSALAMPSALAATPSIISGRIETPVVRILGNPGSPKIELRLRHGANTMQFNWNGPSGQVLPQYFYTQVGSGQQIYQSPPGQGGWFGLYAAAGTWTLASIYDCSIKDCTYYSGDSLAALFPSLTIQVVNPKSDTIPPSIMAATILTPTVTISGNATVQLALTLQDNLSGVSYAGITFGTGDKTSFSVGNSTTYPVVKSAIYQMLASCNCAKMQPGVYPASQVLVQDSAGNKTTITDLATISALFNGQPNITLTN